MWAFIGGLFTVIFWIIAIPIILIIYFTSRPSKEELEERERTAELERKRREREEITRKILEKQRKYKLKEEIRQELLDRGHLIGTEWKRPSIPRDIANAVYTRDNGRCVYCGSTENIHIDHIIPFSRGGASSIENLQLLCQKCNLEKSNNIG